MHVDGRVGFTNGAADDIRFYVAETTAGRVDDSTNMNGAISVPQREWRSVHAEHI